ncbi:hypothetical protein Tco_1569988 [Tanacetum coccineum]
MDVVPRDDIAIDVESLATKYPIVDWKTHVLTENMMYYQIIRGDGSSKNYKIFSEMLDDFDRQDVLDLHRLDQHKLFKGTDDKDAYEHVRRVLEIVDLFHFHAVTHDAIILKVFPITLSGPALRWKNMLSVGLITTWDLLEKVFIRQHCPPFKTNMKLKKSAISNKRWTRHCIMRRKGLDIPTRIRLKYKGFIPMMSPAQALKSVQVMADHSHKWYDEATTWESINDSSNNVDTKKLKENIHDIQVSCKICEGAHLTNDCTLTKEDKAVEQSKYMRSLEEPIIKFYEESIKNMPRMMNGLRSKKDMEEPIPLDLHVVQPYVPPTLFPGNLKKQKDNPYKIRETIGIFGKIHTKKAQEDEGDMDDGWDITIKDIRRLRQILIPTIHTLPNLEPVVQPYMPRGPVRDEVKVIREEELEYNIPLQNGAM